MYGVVQLVRELFKPILAAAFRAAQVIQELAALEVHGFAAAVAGAANWCGSSSCFARRLVAPDRLLRPNTATDFTGLALSSRTIAGNPVGIRFRGRRGVLPCLDHPVCVFRVHAAGVDVLGSRKW
jgi:hypothetical protein